MSSKISFIIISEKCQKFQVHRRYVHNYNIVYTRWFGLVNATSSVTEKKYNIIYIILSILIYVYMKDCSIQMQPVPAERPSIYCIWHVHAPYWMMLTCCVQMHPVVNGWPWTYVCELLLYVCHVSAHNLSDLKYYINYQQCSNVPLHDNSILKSFAA